MPSVTPSALHTHIEDNLCSVSMLIYYLKGYEDIVTTLIDFYFLYNKFLYLLQLAYMFSTILHPSDKRQ